MRDLERGGRGRDVFLIEGARERNLSDCDAGRLVGIALAGDELLDRSDRDALVGDVVVIAPGGQDRQPSSERMCGVDAGVLAHLFVNDKVEPAGLVLDLGEPALEAQKPHAATLPAVQPELGRTAGDVPVGAGNREAGGGPEIEGEDHIAGGSERQSRRGACHRSGQSQSYRSHDGLR